MSKHRLTDSTQPATRARMDEARARARQTSPPIHLSPDREGEAWDQYRARVAEAARATPDGSGVGALRIPLTENDDGK